MADVWITGKGCEGEGRVELLRDWIGLHGFSSYFH